MPQEEAAQPAEDIPGEDQVSRAYFDLPGTLAPETHFPFTYDKVRDERAESVYWRKYAPLIADVHRRGCELQQKWAAAAMQKRYEGAKSAGVQAIREILTGRGHRFNVLHYVQDGDRAHAHIAIERKGGNVKKLSSLDRIELAGLLVHCFSDFQPHACAT